MNTTFQIFWVRNLFEKACLLRPVEIISKNYKDFVLEIFSPKDMETPKPTLLCSITSVFTTHIILLQSIKNVKNIFTVKFFIGRIFCCLTEKFGLIPAFFLWDHKDFSVNQMKWKTKDFTRFYGKPKR